MNSIPKKQATREMVLLWLPRIASLFSFLIIGLFLFGSNEPLVSLTANESIGFACFPIGVLAGMLAGWKWPVIGGVVSISFLLGFYLWHWLTAGSIDIGPWFMIFSSPAFLFLIFGLLNQTKPDNA